MQSAEPRTPDPPLRRLKPPEFFNAGQLRRRGWTDQLIRQFAGPADHLAVNDYHPGGSAVRLYNAERILATEAREDFMQALAAADKRKAAALKALATRKERAAALAAENIPAPVLPSAPPEELIAAAVRWFNETETWRRGAGKWIKISDPGDVVFPVVVNFIRAKLQDYRNRTRPVGLPMDEAIAAADRKVMDAIAESYPWLSEECQR